MLPETRLLLRHPFFLQGDVYTLGVPGSELAPLGVKRGWSPDAHERAVAPFALDGELAPNARAEIALVYLPKGNARRDHVLDLASTIAERLVLVGCNDAGIKTARKAVAARATGPVQSEHGNHAQLVATSLSVVEPKLRERRFEVPIAEGAALTLVSLPGVFSEGRLDDATRTLLDVIEWPARGRVLDLGCGAGPIGLSAKRRVPALDVTLVDVDDYAVEATRRGAKVNALDVEVRSSDGYSAVKGERFDVIVTNPPFHRGVGTEYEVTRAFVNEAPAHLRPDGALWLVANAFLPWEEPLRARFATVDVVAQDRRFVVYRATRPRT
ncbi:MAG: class I SAM-dependent methyltransferase [Myxococcota bacterium]|nr:class I SAM-dependent methyltransferase [Myxococcota bacterium]